MAPAFSAERAGVVRTFRLTTILALVVGASLPRGGLAEPPLPPVADTIAPPGRTLLSDAPTLARWLSTRSPEMGAARARLGQAEAELRGSRLLPNPNLGLAVGTLPLGRTNPAGLSPNDVLNVQVSVNELIELGKRGPRMAAANERRLAARSELIDAIAQRMAEARTSLARVVQLAARSEALGGVVRDARDIARLERVRVQRGDLSGNDYDRLLLETLAIETELAKAQAELRQARLSCQTISLGVCTDLGAADLTLIDRLSHDEGPTLAAGAALDQRPDVQALRHLRGSAEQQGKLAARRVLPDPTLTLGYMYDRFSRAGNQQNSLFVGLTLPLPLFDRGQHDAARAAQQARELDRGLTALRVRAQADLGELAQRYELVRALLARVQNEGSKRSRSVLVTSLEAFRGGQISLTDLLLARRTYVALLLNDIDLRAELYQISVELRRSRGEDTAPVVAALAAHGVGR